MTTIPDYAYVGEELALFEHATNWKAYWSACIRPYLGRRVLDVGAGMGATLKALAAEPGRQWVALEPDPRLCAEIERKIAAGSLPAGIEVAKGITSTYRPDQSFDTALYIDVLEHIEDDRRELETVSGLLTPGGRIVVLAPAHNWLFTPFDASLGHFRRYDKAMLRAVVPKGCRIESLFYLDSVGLLASLGNKLVLGAATPSLAQIKIWDRLLVSASRVIDPLLFRSLGKSIVCVMKVA